MFKIHTFDTHPPWKHQIEKKRWSFDWRKKVRSKLKYGNQQDFNTCLSHSGHLPYVCPMFGVYNQADS